MDPEPIVFDISSDEESYGRIDESRSVDFEWIAKFLGDSGDDQNLSDDADSDDVVVLGEVKGSAKSKSKSTKQMVREENNDDDDDCVVLDGDPDKPVVEEDDSNSKGDSEELLIVSEKGQVACRDFPHPRHLCVTYSFSTSPHEQYCSLCHCYVCDKPAPCSFWENTSSAVDHCHATEKFGTWKIQRRNLKSGIIALPKPAPPPPPLALKLPETSVTGLLPPLNPIPIPIPHRNTVPVPPILRLPQNHVPRPSSSSSSSSSSSTSSSSTGNFFVPTVPIALPKNRFQPRDAPVGAPRFVPSSNNIAPQRPRPGQPVVNLGHRFAPLNPAPPFKRPAIFRPHRTGSFGSGGPFPANQWGSNHIVPGQYPRNPSPTPMQSNLNPMMWQNPSTPGPTVAFGATALPPQQQFIHQLSPPPVGNHQVWNNTGQIPSPGADVIHGEGGPVDYDPSWVNNALNNQQQQPPLVDHFQPRAAELSNANLSSDIGDWLLENPSAPPAQDGSSIPQSNNIYSPEQSSIDLGFFDFETPWSSLTHT